MLKSKLLYFLSFALMFGLASCGDDETEDIITQPSLPSVLQSDAPDSVISGEQISITVGVTANEGLAMIEAFVDGETAAIAMKNSGFISTTSDNFTFTYDTDGDDADMMRTFTVRATDVDGNVGELDINVEVIGSLNTYTAVLLEAPLGNDQSQTFFSASTGMTYTRTEANANPNIIDFGYNFTNQDGAAIVSPSDYLQSIQNLNTTLRGRVTNFRETTLDNFNSTLTGAESRALFDAVGGTPATRARNLAVGDVYAFSTNEGRTGIFRVTALESGANENDGITIEVKTEM